MSTPEDEDLTVRVTTLNDNLQTLAALHQQGATIIHLARSTNPTACPVWEITEWRGRRHRGDLYGIAVPDDYEVRGRCLTASWGQPVRRVGLHFLGGAHPWRAGWPEQEDDPNGR
jgi:hypothetical protein